MELNDLKQKQSLPLEAKIAYSQRRIREFYEHFHGQVYVAFSGGKDSTAMLHLVRELYPKVKAVFHDTGLEYPEIREFVKEFDNVMWTRPAMPFTEILKKYGYPVINKEQAQYIWEYRNTNSEKLKKIRWKGDRLGKNKIQKRWRFLRNAPFQISHKCCHHMKLKPAARIEKNYGLRPYVGVLADESQGRFKKALMRPACNVFDGKRPSSEPLLIWRESDVWDYIREREIPYCKIYDMGYKRTGCMFCMFGVHAEPEPNRFQLMKKTHPKLYDYCINKLGLGEVMYYIGIDYE